jgi:hypothetical protein
VSAPDGDWKPRPDDHLVEPLLAGLPDGSEREPGEDPGAARARRRRAFAVLAVLIAAALGLVAAFAA